MRTTYKFYSVPRPFSTTLPKTQQSLHNSFPYLPRPPTMYSSPSQSIKRRTKSNQTPPQTPQRRLHGRPQKQNRLQLPFPRTSIEKGHGWEPNHSNGIDLPSQQAPSLHSGLQSGHCCKLQHSRLDQRLRHFLFTTTAQFPPQIRRPRR